jgi:hypothetical protein
MQLLVTDDNDDDDDDNNNNNNNNHVHPAERYRNILFQNSSKFTAFET